MLYNISHVGSVVEPDPDPPGAKIILLSGAGSGSKHNTGSCVNNHVLLFRANFALPYKLVLPLLNCLIYVTIHFVKFIYRMRKKKEKLS